MTSLEESAEPAVHEMDAAAGRAELGALCELLVDCVEGGASVGFVLPMTEAKARAFWLGVLADVQAGLQHLFVARVGGRLAGTVLLQPAQKENQPHRADIAKLLVHRRARRHGLGARLMAAAEARALGIGRTVLVLDTATPEAERLYRRAGWQACGAIPDYALMPDGTFCPTTYFYKRLTSRAP
jgi:GNAT superfamily N-acetyltransferase